MVKRTDKGEAFTELISEVFRLNSRLLSAGNAITGPFGLTSARWQVLGTLETLAQPMTVAQIARRMGLARQGVQRIINDLEKAGIVASAENIDHKLAPVFSITASGKKTMARLNASQAEWVNELSDNYTKQHLQAAVATLRSIAERLEEA